MEAVDCGSRADHDWNVCFYLACLGVPATNSTAHDKHQALALKDKLGHLATAIATARGRNINFLTLGTQAEEEVFLAFAQLVGPITVISEVDRQRPDDLRGVAYSSSSRSSVPPVWLLHARDHFKALHLPTQGTSGKAGSVDLTPPHRLTTLITPTALLTLSLLPNGHRFSIRALLTQFSPSRAMLSPSMLSLPPTRGGLSSSLPGKLL
jgi:hypothetical protein